MDGNDPNHQSKGTIDYFEAFDNEAQRLGGEFDWNQVQGAFETWSNKSNVGFRFNREEVLEKYKEDPRYLADPDAFGKYVDNVGMGYQAFEMGYYNRSRGVYKPARSQSERLGYTERYSPATSNMAVDFKPTRAWGVPGAPELLTPQQKAWSKGTVFDQVRGVHYNIDQVANTGNFYVNYDVNNDGVVDPDEPEIWMSRPGQSPYGQDIIDFTGPQEMHTNALLGGVQAYFSELIPGFANDLVGVAQMGLTLSQKIAGENDEMTPYDMKQLTERRLLPEFMINYIEEHGFDKIEQMAANGDTVAISALEAYDYVYGDADKRLRKTLNDFSRVLTHWQKKPSYTVEQQGWLDSGASFWSKFGNAMGFITPQTLLSRSIARGLVRGGVKVGAKKVPKYTTNTLRGTTLNAEGLKLATRSGYGLVTLQMMGVLHESAREAGYDETESMYFSAMLAPFTYMTEKAIGSSWMIKSFMGAGGKGSVKRSLVKALKGTYKKGGVNKVTPSKLRTALMAMGDGLINANKTLKGAGRLGTMVEGGKNEALQESSEETFHAIGEFIWDRSFGEGRAIGEGHFGQDLESGAYWERIKEAALGGLFAGGAMGAMVGGRRKSQEEAISDYVINGKGKEVSELADVLHKDGQISAEMAEFIKQHVQTVEMAKAALGADNPNFQQLANDHSLLRDGVKSVLNLESLTAEKKELEDAIAKEEAEGGKTSIEKKNRLKAIDKEIQKENDFIERLRSGELPSQRTKNMMLIDDQLNNRGEYGNPEERHLAETTDNYKANLDTWIQSRIKTLTDRQQQAPMGSDVRGEWDTNLNNTIEALKKKAFDPEALESLINVTQALKTGVDRISESQKKNLLEALTEQRATIVDSIVEKIKGLKSSYATTFANKFEDLSSSSSISEADAKEQAALDVAALAREELGEEGESQYRSLLKASQAEEFTSGLRTQEEGDISKAEIRAQAINDVFAGYHTLPPGAKLPNFDTKSQVQRTISDPSDKNYETLKGYKSDAHAKLAMIQAYGRVYRGAEGAIPNEFLYKGEDEITSFIQDNYESLVKNELASIYKLEHAIRYAENSKKSRESILKAINKENLEIGIKNVQLFMESLPGEEFDDKLSDLLNEMQGQIEGDPDLIALSNNLILAEQIIHDKIKNKKKYITRFTQHLVDTYGLTSGTLRDGKVWKMLPFVDLYKASRYDNINPEAKGNIDVFLNNSFIAQTSTNWIKRVYRLSPKEFIESYDHVTSQLEDFKPSTEQTAAIKDLVAFLADPNTEAYNAVRSVFKMRPVEDPDAKNIVNGFMYPGGPGAGKTTLAPIAFQIYRKYLGNVPLKILSIVPEVEVGEVMGNHLKPATSGSQGSYKSMTVEQAYKSKKISGEWDIIVLDEASAFGQKQNDKWKSLAEGQPNAKIVFFGDDAQMPYVNTQNTTTTDIEQRVESSTPLYVTYRSGVLPLLELQRSIRNQLYLNASKDVPMALPPVQHNPSMTEGAFYIDYEGDSSSGMQVLLQMYQDYISEGANPELKESTWVIFNDPVTRKKWAAVAKNMGISPLIVDKSFRDLSSGKGSVSALGREVDTVFVAIDHNMPEVNHKGKAIYTAVTRAKNMAFLLAQGSKKSEQVSEVPKQAASEEEIGDRNALHDAILNGAKDILNINSDSAPAKPSDPAVSVFPVFEEEEEETPKPEPFTPQEDVPSETAADVSPKEGTTKFVKGEKIHVSPSYAYRKKLTGENASVVNILDNGNNFEILMITGEEAGERFRLNKKSLISGFNPKKSIAPPAEVEHAEQPGEKESTTEDISTIPEVNESDTIAIHEDVQTKEGLFSKAFRFSDGGRNMFIHTSAFVYSQSLVNLAKRFKARTRKQVIEVVQSVNNPHYVVRKHLLNLLGVSNMSTMKVDMVWQPNQNVIGNDEAGQQAQDDTVQIHLTGNVELKLVRDSMVNARKEYPDVGIPDVQNLQEKDFAEMVRKNGYSMIGAMPIRHRDSTTPLAVQTKDILAKARELEAGEVINMNKPITIRKIVPGNRIMTPYTQEGKRKNYDSIKLSEFIARQRQKGAKINEGVTLVNISTDDIDLEPGKAISVIRVSYGSNIPDNVIYVRTPQIGANEIKIAQDQLTKIKKNQQISNEEIEKLYAYQILQANRSVLLNEDGGFDIKGMDAAFVRPNVDTMYINFAKGDPNQTAAVKQRNKILALTAFLKKLEQGNFANDNGDPLYVPTLKTGNYSNNEPIVEVAGLSGFSGFLSDNADIVLPYAVLDLNKADKPSNIDLEEKQNSDVDQLMNMISGFNLEGDTPSNVDQQEDPNVPFSSQKRIDDYIGKVLGNRFVNQKLEFKPQSFVDSSKGLYKLMNNAMVAMEQAGEDVSSGRVMDYILTNLVDAESRMNIIDSAKEQIASDSNISVDVLSDSDAYKYLINIYNATDSKPTNLASRFSRWLKAVIGRFKKWRSRLEYLLHRVVMGHYTGAPATSSIVYNKHKTDLNELGLDVVTDKNIVDQQKEYSDMEYGRKGHKYSSKALLYHYIDDGNAIERQISVIKQMWTNVSRFRSANSNNIKKGIVSDMQAIHHLRLAYKGHSQKEYGDGMFPEPIKVGETVIAGYASLNASNLHLISHLDNFSQIKDDYMKWLVANNDEVFWTLIGSAFQKFNVEQIRNIVENAESRTDFANLWDKSLVDEVGDTELDEFLNSEIWALNDEHVNQFDRMSSLMKMILFNMPLMEYNGLDAKPTGRTVDPKQMSAVLTNVGPQVSARMASDPDRNYFQILEEELKKQLNKKGGKPGSLKQRLKTKREQHIETFINTFLSPVVYQNGGVNQYSYYTMAMNPELVQELEGNEIDPELLKLKSRQAESLLNNVVGRLTELVTHDFINHELIPGAVYTRSDGSTATGNSTVVVTRKTFGDVSAIKNEINKTTDNWLFATPTDEVYEINTNFNLFIDWQDGSKDRDNSKKFWIETDGITDRDGVYVVKAISKLGKNIGFDFLRNEDGSLAIPVAELRSTVTELFKYGFGYNMSPGVLNQFLEPNMSNDKDQKDLANILGFYAFAARAGAEAISNSERSDVIYASLNAVKSRYGVKKSSLAGRVSDAGEEVDSGKLKYDVWRPSALFGLTDILAEKEAYQKNTATNKIYYDGKGERVYAEGLASQFDMVFPSDQNNNPISDSLEKNKKLLKENPQLQREDGTFYFPILDPNVSDVKILRKAKQDSYSKIDKSYSVSSDRMTSGDLDTIHINQMIQDVESTPSRDKVMKINLPVGIKGNKGKLPVMEYMFPRLFSTIEKDETTRLKFHQRITDGWIADNFSYYQARHQDSVTRVAETLSGILNALELPNAAKQANATTWESGAKAIMSRITKINNAVAKAGKNQEFFDMLRKSGLVNNFDIDFGTEVREGLPVLVPGKALIFDNGPIYNEKNYNLVTKAKKKSPDALRNVVNSLFRDQYFQLRQETENNGFIWPSSIAKSSSGNKKVSKYSNPEEYIKAFMYLYHVTSVWTDTLTVGDPASFKTLGWVEPLQKQAAQKSSTVDVNDMVNRGKKIFSTGSKLPSGTPNGLAPTMEYAYVDFGKDEVTGFADKDGNPVLIDRMDGQGLVMPISIKRQRVSGGGAEGVINNGSTKPFTSNSQMMVKSSESPITASVFQMSPLARNFFVKQFKKPQKGHPDLHKMWMDHVASEQYDPKTGQLARNVSDYIDNLEVSVEGDVDGNMIYTYEGQSYATEPEVKKAIMANESIKPWSVVYDEANQFISDQITDIAKTDPSIHSSIIDVFYDISTVKQGLKNVNMPNDAEIVSTTIDTSDRSIILNPESSISGRTKTSSFIQWGAVMGADSINLERSDQYERLEADLAYQYMRDVKSQIDRYKGTPKQKFQQWAKHAIGKSIDNQAQEGALMKLVLDDQATIDQPLLRGQFLTIMANMSTKNGIKVKQNGVLLNQASGTILGMDLKMPRIETDAKGNKTFIPGEVVMPFVYVEQFGVTPDMSIEEMQRSIQYRLGDEALAAFEEVRTVWVGRIPLSTPGGANVMKAVAFINDNANTIYIPPGFNHLTGGDFDIDKLVTYIKSIDLVKNASGNPVPVIARNMERRAGIQNAMMDVMIDYYQDVRNEVNWKRVTGLGKLDGVGKEEQQLKILSKNIQPHSWSSNKIAHQYAHQGDAMIGISASWLKSMGYLYKVFHKINAGKGRSGTIKSENDNSKGQAISVKDVFKEWDIQTHNEDGDAIVDVFNWIINGATDNNKHNILPSLNITPETSPIALGMVAMGLSLGDIQSWMKSPPMEAIVNRLASRGSLHTIPSRYRPKDVFGIIKQLSREYQDALRLKGVVLPKVIKAENRYQTNTTGIFVKSGKKNVQEAHIGKSQKLKFVEGYKQVKDKPLGVWRMTDGNNKIVGGFYVGTWDEETGSVTIPENTQYPSGAPNLAEATRRYLENFGKSNVKLHDKRNGITRRPTEKDVENLEGIRRALLFGEAIRRFGQLLSIKSKGLPIREDHMRMFVENVHFYASHPLTDKGQTEVKKDPALWKSLRPHHPASKKQKFYNDEETIRSFFDPELAFNQLENFVGYMRMVGDLKELYASGMTRSNPFFENVYQLFKDQIATNSLNEKQHFLLNNAMEEMLLSMWFKTKFANNPVTLGDRTFNLDKISGREEFRAFFPGYVLDPDTGVKAKTMRDALISENVELISKIENNVFFNEIEVQSNSNGIFLQLKDARKFDDTELLEHIKIDAKNIDNLFPAGKDELPLSELMAIYSVIKDRFQKSTKSLSAILPEKIYNEIGQFYTNEVWSALNPQRGDEFGQIEHDGDAISIKDAFENYFAIQLLSNEPKEFFDFTAPKKSAQVYSTERKVQGSVFRDILFRDREGEYHQVFSKGAIAYDPDQATIVPKKTLQVRSANLIEQIEEAAVSNDPVVTIQHRLAKDLDQDDKQIYLNTGHLVDVIRVDPVSNSITLNVKSVGKKSEDTADGRVYNRYASDLRDNRIDEDVNSPTNVQQLNALKSFNNKSNYELMSHIAENSSIEQHRQIAQDYMRLGDLTGRFHRGVVSLRNHDVDDHLLDPETGELIRGYTDLAGMGDVVINETTETHPVEFEWTFLHEMTHQYTTLPFLKGGNLSKEEKSYVDEMNRLHKAVLKHFKQEGLDVSSIREVHEFVVQGWNNPGFQNELRGLDKNGNPIQKNWLKSMLSSLVNGFNKLMNGIFSRTQAPAEATISAYEHMMTTIPEYWSSINPHDRTPVRANNASIERHRDNNAYIAKIEMQDGFRHKNGDLVRYIKTGKKGTENNIKIAKKIQAFNSSKAYPTYKAVRKTVDGEKGDSREYWAILVYPRVPEVDKNPTAVVYNKSSQTNYTHYGYSSSPGEITNIRGFESHLLNKWDRDIDAFTDDELVDFMMKTMDRTRKWVKGDFIYDPKGLNDEQLRKGIRKKVIPQMRQWDDRLKETLIDILHDPIGKDVDGEVIQPDKKDQFDVRLVDSEGRPLWSSGVRKSFMKAIGYDYDGADTWYIPYSKLKNTDDLVVKNANGAILDFSKVNLEYKHAFTGFDPIIAIHPSETGDNVISIIDMSSMPLHESGKTQYTNIFGRYVKQQQLARNAGLTTKNDRGGVRQLLMGMLAMQLKASNPNLKIRRAKAFSAGRSHSQTRTVMIGDELTRIKYMRDNLLENNGPMSGMVNEDILKVLNISNLYELDYGQSAIELYQDLMWESDTPYGDRSGAEYYNSVQRVHDNAKAFEMGDRNSLDSLTHAYNHRIKILTKTYDMEVLVGTRSPEPNTGEWHAAREYAMISKGLHFLDTIRHTGKKNAEAGKSLSWLGMWAKNTYNQEDPLLQKVFETARVQDTIIHDKVREVAEPLVGLIKDLENVAWKRNYSVLERVSDIGWKRFEPMWRTKRVFDPRTEEFVEAPVSSIHFDKNDPETAALIRAGVLTDEHIKLGSWVIDKVEETYNLLKIHQWRQEAHPKYTENGVFNAELARKDAKIWVKANYQRGNVPIVRKNISEHLTSKGGNWASFKDAVVRRWSDVNSIFEDDHYQNIDNDMTTVANVFMGELGTADGYGNRLEQQGYSIGAKKDEDGNDVWILTDPDRNASMTMNLEDSMLYFVTNAHLKIQHESHTLPLANQTRAIYQSMQANSENNMENNKKLLDVYVDRMVHGKQIKTNMYVGDYNITPVINASMALTTFNGLALNLPVAAQSLVMNMLNSWSTALANQIAGIDLFHLDDLAWAASSWFTNKEFRNKMGALLQEHKVILTGARDVANHMTNVYTKKSLFNSHIMHIMNFWTDYVARGIVMAAQMHYDGSWNAYDLTEDNKKVKYNVKKDSRFYNEDGSMVKNADIRIMDIKKNLIQQGDPYQTIDGPLLKGYDREDMNKFKWLSDKYIVGGMDHEAQSALHDHTLSRLFFQFKKFLPDKLYNAAGRTQLSRRGKRQVVKEKDGKRWVEWEYREIEGYLTSLKRVKAHLQGVRDMSLEESSKLSKATLFNIAKMSMDIISFATLYLLYNGLSGSFQDDDDETMALSPSTENNSWYVLNDTRMLRVLKYSALDMISFSPVVIYEMFKDNPVPAATLALNAYELATGDVGKITRVVPLATTTKVAFETAESMGYEFMDEDE